MFSHLLASIFIINMSAQAGATVSAQNLQDGQIITFSETTTRVWDAQVNTSLSIQQFWQAYALRSGGNYWGKRAEYPPYDKVNEHDTVLIEVDSDVCLMEFFHSRWRRANDVRRWDERYNEYSACPKVFD
ncbi:MAG: hypothetical protein ACI88A_001681 [Paraglaciecola sp.]|jgi:hypothetical protein